MVSYDLHVQPLMCSTKISLARIAEYSFVVCKIKTIYHAVEKLKAIKGEKRLRLLIVTMNDHYKQKK